MKFKLYALAAILLISTNLFAGQERGGGYVTDVDGRLMLWDFVEAGIEENAYINSEVDDLMDASKKISTMNIHDEKVKQLVVFKLNEIYQLSPDFALKILDIFLNYQWGIVRYAVNHTNDLGVSPINSSNGFKLIQIAYRDDTQKTVLME